MLASGVIDLISGQTVFADDVRFDEGSYHFTLASTGQDITEDLYRRDKIDLVSNFDVGRENLRVSNERGVGATQNKTFDQADFPDTTLGVLGQQTRRTGNLFDANGVIDGWLDAGKAVVKSAGEAVQNFAKNAGLGAGQSVVPLTALLLVAAVVAYFYFKKSRL